MIRTTSLAEALECLYLKKRAVVIVADEKIKYDSQMYILTKLLQHQGVLLSVQDLEKGNYTKAQSERVIAASRKIKYFLRFVIS
jgi:hypothetical protein